MMVCERNEDENAKERRKQVVEKKEERPGVPLSSPGGEDAALTFPQKVVQRRPPSPVDMGKTVDAFFARGNKPCLGVLGLVEAPLFYPARSSACRSVSMEKLGRMAPRLRLTRQLGRKVCRGKRKGSFAY